LLTGIPSSHRLRELFCDPPSSYFDTQSHERACNRHIPFRQSENSSGRRSAVAQRPELQCATFSMALQSRQMLSFARRCSPCYGQLVGSHTTSASATARPAGESPTSSAATASTSSPLGRADSWGSAWITRVRWASTGGEQPQDAVHDDFDAEALKPQCWKCGAAHCAGRGSMDPLKCGACKAVLPPPPNVEKCMFQLLGE
jgi:hypothetical protein